MGLHNLGAAFSAAVNALCSRSMPVLCPACRLGSALRRPQGLCSPGAHSGTGKGSGARFERARRLAAFSSPTQGQDSVASFTKSHGLLRWTSVVLQSSRLNPMSLRRLKAAMPSWHALAFWSGLIGGILTAVAAGLGVLSWISSQHAQLERDERESRFRMSASAEIAAAHATAESAAAESADAKARIIEAEATIRVADARMAEANLKLAEAINRSKELEAAAARAERELLEVKERIKHRGLTPQQRLAFIDALRKGPRGPVDVLCASGDGEAEGFARELLVALRATAWPVDENVRIGFFAGLGVHLILEDTKQPPPFAVALQAALRAADVEAPASVNPSLMFGPGRVTLLVGGKR